MEGIRTLTATMAVALAMVTFCAPAGATTYNVAPSSDEVSNGDQCSLREAIKAADDDATYNECAAGSGTDTIMLAAGNYPLTIPGADEDADMTGDLDVSASLNIVGAGAATTTIDASALGDRVLQTVLQVSISGVTIKGGQSPPGTPGAGNGPGGERGGGIYSFGDLVLTGVDVKGNSTGGGAAGAAGFFGGQGGSGGGIYCAGSLTLTDSVVESNSTGAGGAGGDGNSGYGGLGGYGGGVAAQSALTVVRSTIANNHTGNGGPAGQPGSTNGGGGGAGGYGGGIYAEAALTITSSAIQGNYTGNGGDATPGATMPATGGNANQGGYGGGVMKLSTAAGQITDSTFSGNHTGNGGEGGPGSGSAGYSGAGGYGGGFEWNSGTVTITGSTFSGNYTGAGGGSALGGLAAAGGFGGGLEIETGDAIAIANSTITGNTTGSGGAGGGSGAGISFSTSSTTDFKHVTIASNQTAAGAAGGGGIFGSSDMTLTNSILASNSPANCYAVGHTITDGGHNISFGDTSCPGAGGDPKLGALADNGGPTKTMALGDGSAALDIVPTDAGCPSADQRGQPRPGGSACDAGAFEFQPPPPVPTDSGSGPGTGGSSTPPPTTNPAVADLVPPVVKLFLTRQRLAKALRKGYIVIFSTNERCSALGQLFALTPLAKRTLVARGTVVVLKTGKAKVVLKFTNKARKAYAHKRTVNLLLVLTVKDLASNATKKTARVVLKR